MAVDAAKLRRALINRITKAEGKFDVVVGYAVAPRAESGDDTRYAIYVHEMTELWHKPPTKSRFLADPFRKIQAEIPSIVQREMITKKRSFSDALMTVGRKLKKESVAEAPIDTGAMRKSAFVAKELHGNG